MDCRSFKRNLARGINLKEEVIGMDLTCKDCRFYEDGFCTLLQEVLYEDKASDCEYYEE